MNPSKKIAVQETKKRFTIIKEFKKFVKNIPIGIMVGGSLGYGPNLAIKRTSDIDLSVIINKSDINKILKTPYLKSKIPEQAVDKFKKGKINMIWFIITINHIDLNIFLYEKNSYEEFCTLKRSLLIFTNDIIIPKTFDRTKFDGKIIEVPSNAKTFLDGQIYEKPNFYKNKYYCDPARFDFLYSNKIISQKSSFFSNLEKSYWKAIIKRLLKEYPHPDLKKENILNTHIIHTITPWRVPKQVVENIKSRTLIELERLL